MRRSASLEEIFENQLEEINQKESTAKSIAYSAETKLYEVWSPFFDLVWKYLSTKKRWEVWSSYRFGEYKIVSTDKGGGAINFTDYGFKIKKGLKTILVLQKYTGIFGKMSSFSSHEIDECYIEELKKIYHDMSEELKAQMNKEIDTANVSKAIVDLTWS